MIYLSQKKILIGFPTHCSKLRWYKSEVLESVAAEYERLGRPLDQADLNPDHIVEFVGAHFSVAPTSSFADPPRPPSSASGLPSTSIDGQPLEDMGTFYVLSNDSHMGWQLHAIALDGQVVQEVTLPDPGPGQFYSMLYSGGEFAVQMPGQQPVPCADLMAGGFDPVAEAGPPLALPLPPGVAPHSVLLPGMTPHQPPSQTGQGVDWVIINL
jgi:hypothetical protein